MDAVYREFGRIDVLVNNAGMSPLYGQLSAVSEELWDKVIGVNLKGPFRLCALVGERMVSRRRRLDHQRLKHGLGPPDRRHRPVCRRQSRRQRDDGRPGGRVRTDGSGQRDHARPVSDEHREQLGYGRLAERAETFPLRRAGEAGEIVGAALYLATEASSFTTGTILTVDGGARWSMPGGGGARP